MKPFLNLILLALIFICSFASAEEIDCKSYDFNKVKDSVFQRIYEDAEELKLFCSIKNNICTQEEKNTLKRLWNEFKDKSLFENEGFWIEQPLMFLDLDCRFRVKIIFTMKDSIIENEMKFPYKTFTTIGLNSSGNELVLDNDNWNFTNSHRCDGNSLNYCSITYYAYEFFRRFVILKPKEINYKKPNFLTEIDYESIEERFKFLNFYSNKFKNIKVDFIKTNETFPKDDLKKYFLKGDWKINNSDAKDLDYKIVFNEDGSYEQETSYTRNLNGSTPIFIYVNGRWSVLNGILLKAIFKNDTEPKTLISIERCQLEVMNALKFKCENDSCKFTYFK